MSLNLPMQANAGGGQEIGEGLHGHPHAPVFITHREIRRRILEGKFHLQHMVVETYFFRRTNLNMHGAARSWVDNLLWHHGCHSVDLAYWVQNDPNLEVWDRRALTIPNWVFPWT